MPKNRMTDERPEQVRIQSEIQSKNPWQKPALKMSFVTLDDLK